MNGEHTKIKSDGLRSMLLRLTICLILTPFVARAQAPTPNQIADRAAAAQTISLASIQKWVDPIDTYAPPHESIPPVPSQIEPGGDTLPPDPLTYARNMGVQDPMLVAWLQRWESGLLHDDETSIQQDTELRDLLMKSTITSEQVYEVARGMIYTFHVEDDPYENVDGACIEATRAAVAHAERELAGLGPLDPKGEPDVHMLTRLTWAWGTGDFPTTERIYRLLAAHTTPNSKRARESAFLCAEAMYRQDKFDDAVTLYTQLDKQNDVLGDVSEQDKAEIHWAIGMTLFYGGHDHEALPYLNAAAANPERSYSNSALALAGSCLVKEKRWKEAVEIYDELVARDAAKTYSSRLQEQLCTALANDMARK